MEFWGPSLPEPGSVPRPSDGPRTVLPFTDSPSAVSGLLWGSCCRLRLWGGARACLILEAPRASLHRVLEKPGESRGRGPIWLDIL